MYTVIKNMYKYIQKKNNRVVYNPNSFTNDWYQFTLLHTKHENAYCIMPSPPDLSLLT